MILNIFKPSLIILGFIEIFIHLLGLDITATYPIRLLSNRINPHDACSIQTKLDMQLFFNIISDVFGLVDPKIIDGFHVSLISLKRKVRPCDIEILNKNLQESLARNSRAFSVGWKFIIQSTKYSLLVCGFHNQSQPAHGGESSSSLYQQFYQSCFIQLL